MATETGSTCGFQAGSTHPSGMFSCFIVKLYKLNELNIRNKLQMEAITGYYDFTHTHVQLFSFLLKPNILPEYSLAYFIFCNFQCLSEGFIRQFTNIAEHPVPDVSSFIGSNFAQSICNSSFNVFCCFDDTVNDIIIFGCNSLLYLKADKPSLFLIADKFKTNFIHINSFYLFLFLQNILASLLNNFVGKIYLCCHVQSYLFLLQNSVCFV